jgi:hypothetical protein
MIIIVLIVLWLMIRSAFCYPFYRRPMFFGPMFYPMHMHHHHGPTHFRGHGHMGGMGGHGHGPMGGHRF